MVSVGCELTTCMNIFTVDENEWTERLLLIVKSNKSKFMKTSHYNGYTYGLHVVKHQINFSVLFHFFLIFS